tara:strand:+ start:2830 stop:4170 length:1341 start_codon:yes stop_codon:yes gene_type:complete
MMERSIVVFTRDLRVVDNPALSEAAKQGEVFPLFIFDQKIVTSNDLGSKRFTFLLESLDDLHSGLQKIGSSLFLRAGNWVEEVINFCKEREAQTIHLAIDHSNHSRKRFADLQKKADQIGVQVKGHHGISVVEPGAITPASGEEYKMFSPYYQKWKEVTWRDFLPAPQNLHPVERDQESLKIFHNFRPEKNHTRMKGGEHTGRISMQAWMDKDLKNYSSLRNDLATDRTSRLSPYLHFGCLSSLEVALLSRGSDDDSFVRQVCWRDFYLQVLSSHPEASFVDYRSRNFQWRSDATQYEAWKEGITGYPIVDAAMRQLLHEGFMHNRTRMVVASFLTKDLHIDWRLGAKHFMEHLLDGDIASNQLNWQWVAGTGTDYNPHRIFNPIRQSERFDKDGEYIRRWVPELRQCSGQEIHDPGPLSREEIGYPQPIVDHGEAIKRYKQDYAS